MVDFLCNCYQLTQNVQEDSVVLYLKYLSILSNNFCCSRTLTLIQEIVILSKDPAFLVKWKNFINFLKVNFNFKDVLKEDLHEISSLKNDNYLAQKYEELENKFIKSEISLEEAYSEMLMHLMHSQ